MTPVLAPPLVVGGPTGIAATAVVGVPARGAVMGRVGGQTPSASKVLPPSFADATLSPAVFANLGVDLVVGVTLRAVSLHNIDRVARQWTRQSVLTHRLKRQVEIVRAASMKARTPILALTSTGREVVTPVTDRQKLSSLVALGDGSVGQEVGDSMGEQLSPPPTEVGGFDHGVPVGVVDVPTREAHIPVVTVDGISATDNPKLVDGGEALARELGEIDRRHATDTETR